MPLYLLLGLLTGCHSTDYVQLYATEDKAPSLRWEDIGDLEHLGPTRIDEGVNFSVFSANATRIDLLLFDDPESTRPSRQFEMTRFGDVWNVYVEGIGTGQHYGLVAWGPNWTEDADFYPGSMHGFRADVDEDGNRFNPNKLLTDPYGKALHREHDWGGGFPASGPYAAQSTYAAGAKSVVVESDYEWSDHEETWRAARRANTLDGHDWNDLVIYEVHVKGFSENAGSNRWGVEHFGTYRGLGEGAGYLADLGVTAVELLPIHEKPTDGGYWGYNNISFFAPELSYSASYAQTGEVDEVLDEFKEMVDKLHQEGIEVILDVVYNHTGEGGLWRTKLFYDDNDSDGLCDPSDAVNLDSLEVASLYNLRGLDNQSYYVLTEDGQFYWDHTGVGNQTRANNLPMRKLILDSLHFYVEEMHVDGFRFDLAGVLGEPDLGYDSYWEDAADTVLADIAEDPVLQEHNVRIIAEPWTTAYDPSTNFPIDPDSDLPYGWAEWNANFRDWWRGFINQDLTLGDYEGAISGGGAITGSEERYYESNGRQPWHSINFVTIHDGFTMFDLLSYESKENGCGPLNPICCYDACSAWCDPTSGESNNHSANWSEAPTKRQMMRNLFVGLLISHGTPTLLGGDEWMRTQYGNNNAYSTWSDNEWNWFRWGEWTSENTNNLFRLRMHDFARDLIAFRKSHTYALSPKTWGGGMPLAWKDENNQESSSVWTGRHVMIHYYDDGSWEEPELAILINMEDESVTFELPSGRTWGRVVDTQSYYDLPGNMDESDYDGYFNDNPDADPTQSANIWLDDPLAVSGSYTVPADTIVILEEQQ